jgi:hypothetical protein
VPKHLSFLQNNNNYLSLYLPLSSSLSLSLSLFLSLSLSFSLSLSDRRRECAHPLHRREKEGERKREGERGREKEGGRKREGERGRESCMHAFLILSVACSSRKFGHALSIPHSFNLTVSMLDYYINVRIILCLI